MSSSWYTLTDLRAGLSGALLALGSLVLVGCGDDTSSPPDARRPPDASQAPDASRPADASPTQDASRPDDASGLDGASGDAATTDATTVFRCGSFPDSLEPNDSSDTAPTVPPEYVSENPSWINGSWVVTACLASGNEDWYRIDASQLRFDLDPNFAGQASIRLRGLVEGGDLCRGGCGAEPLPALPENTLTVAVFRASDKASLTTRTDTQGVVAIGGAGADYTGDLLIRVSGPPEALYNYRLSIFIDVEGSEDECEC